MTLSTAAQQSEISFATTEGTWLSLDVAPNGASLVLEILGDVYTLPVDGGNARALLTGSGFQSQPRFSPDGDYLVYVNDESGSDNVWISRSDGSDAHSLTSLRGMTFVSPAWSADGSGIYVTAIRSGFRGVAEIWRYDVTTGEGQRVVENANGTPQPLVSAPAPGAYGPTPTPDGTGFYYTSVTPRQYGSRNGATSSVMRFDVETGEQETVTVDGPIAMKPAPSPDGRWLVYATVKDGRTGLKARNLESGTEHWLAYPIQRNQLEGRATRDVLPNFAFAPDGQSVFLELNGHIHRLGIEDGSDTVVPFEAQVSLTVTPRLHFSRRVETGPVRARAARQLAIGPGGRAAFSALARIWVLDEDDGRPRRLTATARPREFMPAWSADGRWIAFVTWDEKGGHLWKTRSDGSGDPVRLSPTSAFWADPAFTPDGSALVAITAPLESTRSSRQLVPANAEIVVVPFEGGAPKKIGRAFDARDPHFGKDNGRVFLTSPTNGLVSVGLEGGVQRTEATLPRVSGGGRLVMSPAGDYVLGVVGPELRRFALPPTGDAETAIDTSGAITITTDGPLSFGWSTDGSTIAWLAGMELSQADSALSDDGRLTMRLDVSVPRSVPSGSVALRGALIVTMQGDEVIEDGDLVVSGNRISAVGARGAVQIPADARVIDVSGKTIVPGFIDVHAHFGASSEMLQPESNTSFANLAYGITSLRNPQAPVDVFELADVIDADGVPGPRIFSTGPGLFSGLNLESLDHARRVLGRYRDEYGTHLIKSYLVGDREQRQWVVAAARELGMMPTTEGGADTRLDLTHAIDGFSGNEHGLPVAPIHDDVIQLMARTGITYTPTLVVSFGAALPVYRLLAEQRPHENPKINRWFGDGELYARSSSRLLWFPPEDYNDVEVGQGANDVLQAGGRVALGGHGEVQGLSAHWEMMLLARSGMKLHDVLRVATIFGAEAIGLEQDLGSLEEGKLADLVVLDGNPLQKIEATQSVRYVMKNGVLYQGTTLDRVWPRAETLATPWWTARPMERAGQVTAIEELVRNTMDVQRIPGIAVAVVRQGEVLLSKGFGIGNIETGTTVSDQTMFQSGSLGKQFASAGIMALSEDGRLDLDDSVREYLPETPDSWQSITLRHLLTHSSGIPDYTSEGFDYATDYTEDDLVRMASQLELEFPAGTRWNYSNTGYVMLGVVMSRITGMPYWDFLRQRIFDPAGMPTIRVNTQSDIVPNRAQGYLPVDGGWQHAGYVAPLTNTGADGSMLLNLRDLIAWNEVVRNRRTLSEESWNLILNPMTLNSGSSYPYGYGWFIEEAGEQIVHQHGGAWQGFISQFTRFSEDDLAVIVLMNARNLGGPDLANGIAALVNPSLERSPPPTEPIADPDPDATRFVAAVLSRVSDGQLELSDFAFVRQTVFPRMRRALIGLLEGMGPPDRLELLERREVGDDRALQYRALYGERRFQVIVSLGPEGGLTALRVVPEG